MPVELPAGVVSAAGVDVVARSVTVKPSGPYTATAVAGGADYGAAVRIASGRPWIDPTHPTFAGGAKGDGVTNDSAAFQAAINAACLMSAELRVPCPPSIYLLNTTVLIQPQAGGPVGGQVYMNIKVDGPAGTGGGQFQWGGANSNPIFRAFGWKESEVHGMRININSPSSAVVGWELDVDATRLSTGNTSFYDCTVRFASGATGCVAWRMGHAGGLQGGSELSGLNYYSCVVNATAAVDGNYGWVDEHPNGLNYGWYGCTTSFLKRWFTNVSMAGAASAVGGNAKWFVNCYASLNTQDFEFSPTGSYGIWGGRYESGTLFMATIGGSSGMVITVDAVELSNYTASAIVFALNNPGTYNIRGLRAYGTLQTAAFITFGDTGATRPAILHLTGCAVYTTSDPLWTFSPGEPQFVYAMGNVQMNSASQVTTRMLDRVAGAHALCFPATSTLGANVTSVTFTGNDRRGTIAIVMSGALGANTKIATCTFFAAFGNTPLVFLINQTAGAGLANVNFYRLAFSTGVSFDLACDQALAAGTYTVAYMVEG